MADEKTILPLLVNNQTVVSAGGLDIKVVGNTITFTIGQTNWEMTVAELESMLESHQLLINSCKKITDNITKQITQPQLEAGIELYKGVKSAIEALRRANVG